MMLFVIDGDATYVSSGGQGFFGGPYALCIHLWIKKKLIYMFMFISCLSFIYFLSQQLEQQQTFLSS